MVTFALHLIHPFLLILLSLLWLSLQYQVKVLVTRPRWWAVSGPRSSPSLRGEHPIAWSPGCPGTLGGGWGCELTPSFL